MDEKDIPMSDNMKVFFNRLIELKLFALNSLKENKEILNVEYDPFFTHKKLLKVISDIYNKLDELIKEKE